MSAELGDLAPRLAAARAGSRDALGELFAACHGYLLLVARKELDADLQAKGGASDLVQDTFLEAQRDFERFGGHSEEEFLAWLRRLLLNNLANFGRQYRTTAKRSVDREIALGNSDLAQGLARSLSTDTPSPSGHAVAREQADALERALQRLPEDHRQVLLLRYQEGQAFEEIALAMQRSANAVRKLWARALERLQQEMDTTP